MALSVKKVYQLTCGVEGDADLEVRTVDGVNGAEIQLMATGLPPIFLTADEAHDAIAALRSALDDLDNSCQ